MTDNNELVKVIKELNISVNKQTEYLKSIAMSIHHRLRYENFYDITNTITTAGAVDPNDFDSKVYNRERIYSILGRSAERVTVNNKSHTDLFLLISHGNTTELYFSHEATIPQGAVVEYYNVNEIRLRSAIAGSEYRVSEYPLNLQTDVRLEPLEKVSIFNTSITEDVNFLPTAISPINPASTFIIYCVFDAAGELEVDMTPSGLPAIDFTLNEDTALTNNTLYTFKVPAISGATYNFNYGVDGKILLFIIYEINSVIS